MWDLGLLKPPKARTLTVPFPWVTLQLAIPVDFMNSAKNLTPNMKISMKLNIWRGS